MWVHISPFGGPQIIAVAASFSHSPPPNAIWDGGCSAVAPGGPAAGLSVSGLRLNPLYNWRASETLALFVDTGKE